MNPNLMEPNMKINTTRKIAEEIVATHCLVPECLNSRKFRGLCPSHYRTAIHYVHSGRVTWDQLVEKGKALKAAAGRPAGKTGEWFLT
jgi:hypothetical protein